MSKILSPLIIHLIELEISQQFLGQLENVNGSKPLTERNRYAAVMLLGDVRRRLHYGMNYVYLSEKVYLDVQREFEQVQAAIEVLGQLVFWGLRQMRLVSNVNSVICRASSNVRSGSGRRLPG